MAEEKFGKIPLGMAATAYSGYFSEDNIMFFEDALLRPFMATGELKHGEAPSPVRGRSPRNMTPKEATRRKLATKTGQAIYSRRKCAVEPVFVQIKQARELRQFLLRGKKSGFCGVKNQASYAQCPQTLTVWERFLIRREVFLAAPSEMTKFQTLRMVSSAKLDGQKADPAAANFRDHYVRVSNGMPMESTSQRTLWQSKCDSCPFFKNWMRAGFFVALWRAGLAEYDDMEGIAWRWQSIDGAMVKTPLAQEAVGRNPTDRGKKRTSGIFLWKAVVSSCPSSRSEQTGTM